MRSQSILILALFASLLSWNPILLEISADFTLDELSDKHDYTEAMTIAINSYDGKRVDKVLVNGSKPDTPDVLEHLMDRCVFANCGQGLELGYSSSSHQLEVESCRFMYPKLITYEE